MESEPVLEGGGGLGEFIDDIVAGGLLPEVGRFGKVAAVEELVLVVAEEVLSAVLAYPGESQGEGVGVLFFDGVGDGGSVLNEDIDEFDLVDLVEGGHRDGEDGVMVIVDIEGEAGGDVA